MKKIYLVDTNAYVRIAKHLQILGDHGELSLRLTSELAGECAHSPNLKSKFAWMHSSPHPETRAKWTLPAFRDDVKARIIKRSADLRSAVAHILEDFKDQKIARGDSRQVLSQVDESVACIAYVQKYGVITDEGPLTRVCEEFEIECLSTLDILKILHSGNFVTIAVIEDLVIDWQQNNDTPKDWRQNYERLFGRRPPHP